MKRGQYVLRWRIKRGQDVLRWRMKRGQGVLRWLVLLSPRRQYINNGGGTASPDR